MPPGLRVLELGCGLGDLLAAVKPAQGVGVDFSGAMLEQARQRHPELEFCTADAAEGQSEGRFDYILLSDLVNDLHAVNTSLEEAGFGPQLLCSLVGFREEQQRSLALVYLYKRGTFYPFAPQRAGGEKRDNPLELQVRAMLGDDLTIEKDLARWFPVWGAPGL